jgi:MoxR-like ATPase
MSLELHHASKATEIQILQAADPRSRLEDLRSIFASDEILIALKQVEAVKLGEVVATYIANLLERTRGPSYEGTPLSTRAGMALSRAAKAWAFLAGRDYVRVEDIQEVIIPVLGHRLGGNHGIKRGREWAELLKKSTPIPI